MLHIGRYLNRRLTRWQTAAAILIVIIAAGLGYLAYNLLTAFILQARVRAAMPTMCAAIRQQRGELVSAIEAYKAHFGIYPPDHVVSRQPTVVDAIKNPLLYELAGVIYNPANKMFELRGLEPADAKYVKEFFQCDGFKNSGESSNQITRFLSAYPLPARQLHDDPDVFAAGFQVSYDGLEPEVVWEFDVSPWRYISSAPTNNPGRFDLWMEVKTKTQTVTIGNWKVAE